MGERCFPLLKGNCKRVFLLACLLVTLLFPSGCNKAQNSAGDLPVLVGIEPTAVNTFIYVAEAQNYFADNGLKVTIKEYASGMDAVNGMLNNEVNLATSSEYILVGKALAGESIRSLGSIDKFMHNYLFARKDHGIASATDLRGKKIGLTQKTAAEFYLGRFLELRNIPLSEVNRVNLAPADVVEALEKGVVDAVVAWQPNAKKIEDEMGDSVLRWPVQNEQASYCIVSATEAWVIRHPQEIRRFMRAMAQAEDFITEHPDQAKVILQNRLKYNQDYISAIWPEHVFQLSVNQALILVMEDEARWLINDHQTSATQPPNFLDYIDVDGIESVKPEGVNIIR